MYTTIQLNSAERYYTTIQYIEKIWTGTTVQYNTIKRIGGCSVFWSPKKDSKTKQLPTVPPPESRADQHPWANNTLSTRAG